MVAFSLSRYKPATNRLAMSVGPIKIMPASART